MGELSLVSSAPLAAASIAAFAFLRWLIPFACQRLDARADRLERREKDVESRMNKRLEFVELELDLYRSATMKLVNRMAEKLPADPILQEVARMLRIAPRPTASLDELAEKLAAIPATGGN